VPRQQPKCFCIESSEHSEEEIISFSSFYKRDEWAIRVNGVLHHKVLNWKTKIQTLTLLTPKSLCWETSILEQLAHLSKTTFPTCLLIIYPYCFLSSFQAVV
jgi:hypothetical protein